MPHRLDRASARKLARERTRADADDGNLKRRRRYIYVRSCKDGLTLLCSLAVNRATAKMRLPTRSADCSMLKVAPMLGRSARQVCRAAFPYMLPQATLICRAGARSTVMGHNIDMCRANYITKIVADLPRTAGGTDVDGRQQDRASKHSEDGLKTVLPGSPAARIFRRLGCRPRERRNVGLAVRASDGSSGLSCTHRSQKPAASINFGGEFQLAVSVFPSSTKNRPGRRRALAHPQSVGCVEDVVQ